MATKRRNKDYPVLPVRIPFTEEERRLFDEHLEAESFVIGQWVKKAVLRRLKEVSGKRILTLHK